MIWKPRSMPNLLTIFLPSFPISSWSTLGFIYLAPSVWACSDAACWSPALPSPWFWSKARTVSLISWKVPAIHLRFCCRLPYSPCTQIQLFQLGKVDVEENHHSLAAQPAPFQVQLLQVLVGAWRPHLWFCCHLHRPYLTKTQCAKILPTALAKGPHPLLEMLLRPKLSWVSLADHLLSTRNSIPSSPSCWKAELISNAHRFRA